MTIRRTTFIATLALGICVTPFAADAQQATPAPEQAAGAQQAAPAPEHATGAQQAASAPEHIRTTQAFLKAWGNQRWDELRAVTSDHVTVKLGTDVFTLEPAAQKSEVMLVFPFRGMSTVRTDGKVTGIKVDDIGLKVGDRETRGPGMINLQEVNGQFRITDVSAASPAQ